MWIVGGVGCGEQAGLNGPEEGVGGEGGGGYGELADFAQDVELELGNQT
mgnify:CR=1 FL=1